MIFNLSAVLSSIEVWLVEGEKDVLTLLDLGLVATTAPFGVNHWEPEFTKYFKDKVVNICLDKGYEEIAELRAAELSRVARQLKVISLPGLEKGEDVTDWFERMEKDADVEPY